MVDEAKKPWWQLTRSPVSGFVLAGTWTVLAVLRWTDTGPRDRVDLIVACLVTVLAASYLASATAMLRRERVAVRSRRG